MLVHMLQQRVTCLSQRLFPIRTKKSEEEARIFARSLSLCICFGYEAMSFKAGRSRTGHEQVATEEKKSFRLQLEEAANSTESD